MPCADARFHETAAIAWVDGAGFACCRRTPSDSASCAAYADATMTISTSGADNVLAAPHASVTAATATCALIWRGARFRRLADAAPISVIASMTIAAAPASSAASADVNSYRDAAVTTDPVIGSVPAAAHPDGRTPELNCRDVKATLVRLVAALNELKVELISLETEEPNLERVFLHLTGRGLRD